MVMPMSPFDKDPAAGFNYALAAALRAEKGVQRLSWGKLATRSGIPQRTLIRLLNGERMLGAAHLHSLSEALNIPLEILIERAKSRL